jgi:DNA-binding NarL/FixJ family response regulator
MLRNARKPLPKYGRPAGFAAYSPGDGKGDFRRRHPFALGEDLVGGQDPDAGGWSPEKNARYHTALTRLSVVLVNPSGLTAAALERLPLRRGGLEDVSEKDDVVVLCGPEAGHGVRDLAARFGGTMPPVIVVAPDIQWDDLGLALGHGAANYVIEGETPPGMGSCLAEMIVNTAAGMSLLAPRAATMLVKSWVAHREPRESARTDTVPVSLTNREMEVMRLIADGYSPPEIAELMSLNPRTVRNHLSRIYAKLHVNRQSEALLAWLGLPLRHREP